MVEQGKRIAHAAGGGTGEGSAGTAAGSTTATITPATVDNDGGAVAKGDIGFATKAQLDARTGLPARWLAGETGAGVVSGSTAGAAASTTGACT